MNNADVSESKYLPKDFESDEIMLNPNDKYAIEAALQLKEKSGAGTVKAVCLGSKNALTVLREAIAMGCDEAVQISESQNMYLSPFSKSEIIAKAIQKLGITDMILFGMASNDFGSSQLASLVAARLDLPQATYANSLDLENANLVVSRYVEGGSIKIKIKTPCVVSVASTANEPRYTSVKRILVAKKATIPVLSYIDLGTDPGTLEKGSGMELMGIGTPEKSKSEVFKVAEDDPEKSVSLLLQRMKSEGVDLGGFRH